MVMKTGLGKKTDNQTAGAAAATGGSPKADSFEMKTARWSMRGSARVRLRLYRKLSGLLRNGVALQQALDVLWNRASENGRKRKATAALAIDEWRRVVRNGRRFGEALEGWAPPAECLIIDAGELAGRLDSALIDAVVLQQGTQAMKGAIIGGVAYPITIMVFIVGVLYLFASEIIPAFESVASRDKWTGVAAGLAIMSDVSRNYTIPFVIAVTILVVAIIFSLPRWDGKVRTSLDRYFPYSLYRALVGTSFMLSLGGLLKAGVQIPQALKRLQRNSTPWLKARIDGALRGVLSGLNLGEAFQRAGHGFPEQELVDDMRVYAELANFDDFMDSIGREWLKEAIEKIELQSKLIFNVLLASLGIFVMWLTWALMMLQKQVVDIAQMPQ